MIKISRRESMFLVGSALLLPSCPAFAADHKVEMLNKHPDNPKIRSVFFPRIVVVQPGDSVTFVPTDKGHNSQSIKGMIPDSAKKWKGKINKEVTVTFETPGFYGYKCTPHLSLGMVGLVIVEGEGKLANLEAARAVKQRGKAKKAWDEIWAQAESDGALS